MPLQQLQMIGDLKAENEILKEANANLVNRWENYSSVQKFSSSFKKIVTSWIMINFKICNSMNVFFPLILPVLLTQKERGNTEQSTGKWRYLHVNKPIYTLHCHLYSLNQTNFNKPTCSVGISFSSRFRDIAVCLDFLKVISNDNYFFSGLRPSKIAFLLRSI